MWGKIVTAIQELLSKAQQYQQQGDVEQAMSLLGEAGNAGHSYAALDYGYFLARQDAAAATRYLQQIPDSQSPTIRYHTALIKRFYLYNAFTTEVIESLVSLAQDGHAESILVLASWCIDSQDIYRQIVAHLALTKPNIYKQLVADSQRQVEPAAMDFCEQTIERCIRERERRIGSLTRHELSADIDLVAYSDALSAFECRYMTTRFQPLLGPSLVANPIDGKPLKDNVRTSEVASITAEMADWIVRDIDLRLATLSGTIVQSGEPTNLLRYQSGQEYRGHYDAFADSQVNTDKMQADGGQRVTTVLAYLNTVDGEGETVFPRLDIEVKPEQGTVIAFANVDENLALRKNSYHCGRPVEQQQKWTLTKWVRKETTQYGKFTHGLQIKENKDV